MKKFRLFHKPVILLCLLTLCLITTSCRKKAQAFRMGARAATSKVIQRVATYAFGVAFLMRVEEIMAEKMFESFTSEPTKNSQELGTIIIYNNDPNPLNIELTTDGKNWETYHITPKDSITIMPNEQGLAFISSESRDNTFVRLEPNKEYAVKIENNQKVVDEIQRQ